MMCLQVYPDTATTPCPPKPSAASQLTLIFYALHLLRETIRLPHCMTYQNPTLLKSQVHPNFYPVSHLLKNHQHCSLMRSLCMMFHQGKKNSPKLPVTRLVGTNSLSAGGIQASLLNSNKFVSSEEETWTVCLSMAFQEVKNKWCQSREELCISPQETSKGSAQPPALPAAPPPARVILWL